MQVFFALVYDLLLLIDCFLQTFNFFFFCLQLLRLWLLLKFFAGAVLQLTFVVFLFKFWHLLIFFLQLLFSLFTLLTDFLTHLQFFIVLFFVLKFGDFALKLDNFLLLLITICTILLCHFVLSEFRFEFWNLSFLSLDNLNMLFFELIVVILWYFLTSYVDRIAFLKLFSKLAHFFLCAWEISWLLFDFLLLVKLLKLFLVSGLINQFSQVF